MKKRITIEAIEFKDLFEKNQKTGVEICDKHNVIINADLISSIEYISLNDTFTYSLITMSNGKIFNTKQLKFEV